MDEKQNEEIKMEETELTQVVLIPSTPYRTYIQTGHVTYDIGNIKDMEDLLSLLADGRKYREVKAELVG